MIIFFLFSPLYFWAVHSFSWYSSTLYPDFRCTLTVRIFFEMYCEMPCIAPRPKSEASCAPASVDMLMLLPSELPMFAPISFAASISIEPGMKMPACPSLSYTSSSTGMMLPPYSSEVMPMPSLSPCNRAAPTRSVFRE